MFIKLNTVNLIFIFRATNFFKRNGVIDNILLVCHADTNSVILLFFIFARSLHTERISVRFSSPQLLFLPLC